MRAITLGLISLVWLLSLVPGVWFIALSPAFLQTSPGQEATLRMWLLVGGLWLYPLTVLVSQAFAWRRKSLSIALAPLAHLACLLALLLGMGTFA